MGSQLDGMVKSEDVAKKALEYGHPAVAITDHGLMSGILEHYRACRKHGVKPIIGLETYVVDDRTGQSTDNHHLVLLAATQEGYKNLCHIASDSGTIGRYDGKNRADNELLRQYGKGIIASSACLGGEIPRALADNDWDKAVSLVNTYKEIFDDFYLELQSNNLEEQAYLNTNLIRLARMTNTELIITNDVHYTEKDDFETHDLLLGIQTKRKIDDPKKMRMPGGNNYWFKTEQEVRDTAFYFNPETQQIESIPSDILNAAISNTVRIAEQCNVDIEFHRNLLPVFEVPEGHTLESYLEQQCKEALWHYLMSNPGLDYNEYHERLETELRVINKKGFPSYFLIVADVIQYAKEQDIAIGDGRGSAAGSLVSFLLKITGLDPIKYDLLFERFLNEERNDSPDIDIDFDATQRHIVLDYVQRKYGADKIAQIGTLGTFAAKNAVRRVAATLGYSTKVQNELSKAIPDEPKMTIEKALENSIELNNLYEEYQEVFEHALKIEGLTSNSSIHAAGVVISPISIGNEIPLMHGGSDEIVTQFTKDDIEALGFLKMDFLALKSLTVIKQALNFAGLKYYETLEKLHPFTDPEVYRYISQGDTEGIFQLESHLFKGLIKDVPPLNFNDVSLLIALGRPGPLQFAGDFASRRRGVQFEYIHPSLEPILKDTQGIAIFQEQVMQIAQVIAGFSLGEADLLRRAIAGKKEQALKEQYSKFTERSLAQGHTPELIEELLHWIEPFANYAFNRSHSACYAVLSYFTAWLKVYHPTEFWASIITSVAEGNKKDRDEKIANYITKARSQGIRFLPPDINESPLEFTVSTLADGSKGIRFGLTSIKGVGPKAIDAILEAREQGPFQSIADFDARVDRQVIKSNVVRVLIMSGCFDSFHPDEDRHALYKEYADLRTERKQKTPMIDKSNDFDFTKPYTKRARRAYEMAYINLSISDPTAWQRALEGNTLTLKGTVSKIRNHKDRQGRSMAFVTIETTDKETVELVVFSSVYENSPELNTGLDVRVHGEKNNGKLLAKTIRLNSGENVKENYQPPITQQFYWNPLE